MKGGIMNGEQQWALIRQGAVEQGLCLMEESFNKTPRQSTLITLGLAYLWTQKYEAVIRHFQGWMTKYQVTLDFYFSLVGVAQWCLDEPIASSDSWRSGLGAMYIDAAGGMECPLLLWIASVLRPNDALRRRAAQILGEKVESPKVSFWPGPLAQFVLDQIDENVLHERSIDRRSFAGPASAKWEVPFYRHVRELECGRLHRGDFEEIMSGLVDTSDPAWSESEDFLQLVRIPEFYIARHEVSVARMK